MSASGASAAGLNLGLIVSKSAIVHSIETHFEWFADAPPDGSRGNLLLDLALADAFRMLIKLDDTKARMRWIERQMPAHDNGLSPYQKSIARWWLDLYDLKQEKFDG